jgi:hypothetical protein
MSVRGYSFVIRKQSNDDWCPVVSDLGAQRGIRLFAYVNVLGLRAGTGGRLPF